MRHPDSDVYMVSVVNDEFQWVGHPEDFNWDLLRGKHIVAHNMSFDGTVLKFLQERGLVPSGREVGGRGRTKVCVGGPARGEHTNALAAVGGRVVVVRLWW